MSEAVRNGRCLCGQVTVELTGEPFAVSLCHCVNCQKTSGSAFSVIALVPIWLNGGIAGIRPWPAMAVRNV